VTVKPSFAQQAVDALQRADDEIERHGMFPSDARPMLEIQRAQALASLAVADAIDDLRRSGLPVERVP
jgi:hypothetical protein